MSVDRGFTWMDDETIALIEIWGKGEIQSELGNAKRNFSVYERIARELSDIGFNRTAYQCREKIKRLRKEYQLARYCMQHNISQKKPMKYFEQVDGVLNRDRAAFNISKSHSSDTEGELRFTFNPDLDSNPVTNNVSLQPTILSGPSTTSDSESKMGVGIDQSFCSHNDSSDTVIGNDEEEDIFNRDCDLDEDSPWVPNVVLVENDQDANTGFDGSPTKEKSSRKSNSQKDNSDPQLSEDESPFKKRRMSSKTLWFKTIMDKVTEKFLDYQRHVDSQFLDRITSLERERIKRDEAMQKMWMEFEDRRRKEEQQHELKIMALFGQFVNQVLENGNAEPNS